MSHRCEDQVRALLCKRTRIMAMNFYIGNERQPVCTRTQIDLCGRANCKYQYSLLIGTACELDGENSFLKSFSNREPLALVLYRHLVQ